jgi:hypothetical protein
MSTGPWKAKPSVMMNALRAFKRVTKLSDDAIQLLVNPADGSFLISAKSPDPVMHARDASLVALERIESLKTGTAGTTGD